MNWAWERNPLKGEGVVVVEGIARERKIKKRKRTYGTWTWNGMKLTLRTGLNLINRTWVGKMIAGILRSVNSEREIKLKQETWGRRTMKITTWIREMIDLRAWAWKTLKREWIVWGYEMNTSRVTRWVEATVFKVSTTCHLRRWGILKVYSKSKCQSLSKIKTKFWRVRSILNILSESNWKETIWVWTRHVSFTNIFQHYSWENLKTEITSNQKPKTHFKRPCWRNRCWSSSNIRWSRILQTITKIKQTFVLSWH